MARDNFNGDEFKDNLSTLADEFDLNGNYNLAEKVYIEAKCPEKAIKMYKQIGDW